MQQPALGIVWTLSCLALGSVAVRIGTCVLKIDVMVFLVTVPIPDSLGTIIVRNKFPDWLTAKLTQPAKGIVNAILVAIIGTLLAQLYRALVPTVTGALNSGPPTYDLEIWLASALLSVTFPLLIFFAEFLKFWPLAKSE